MDVCDPIEEPALEALKGLNLQHELQLSIEDWRAWTSITELLKKLGAEVDNLQLVRIGAGYSVRCRLNGVSEHAARTLTHTLLDSGLAERASVEHLVVAGRGR